MAFLDAVQAIAPLDIGCVEKIYIQKQYMRQKKGFTLRTVCGEHVIVAEGLEVINFNKLLSLNESAAFLWEQAATLGDFTTEQLADKLCEEYDVTREQALEDVGKMIAQWQEIGVVE